MISTIKCLATVCICLAVLSKFAFAVSYYTSGHADLRMGVGDTLIPSLYCDGAPSQGAAFAAVDGTVLTADQNYPAGEIIICSPQSTFNYVHNTLGGANSDIAAHLGIATGDDYWFLPQSSIGAGSSATLFAPYLGLGTQQMSLGVFEGDVVDFTLLAMSGPSGGQFAMSQLPSWLVCTADGITSNDQVPDFLILGHGHCKYYFSKPGVYRLTMQSSATRTSTGVLETAVDTYTFLVGTEIWKGTASGDWNNAANWKEGAVPGYGSTVIFTTSTVPNQPLIQNIPSALDLHGLVFTANAGAFQLGGQTIRLSVDSPEISSESPNNQIIGNPLELTADTTFSINGTGNITLSGTVSGSGSLTKIGSGELILASEANHSGDTLISDGVLALSASGQILNSAIENDATFQILAGDHIISNISGSGITQVLAGTLTVGSISQGTLTIGSSDNMACGPQSAFFPNNNSQPVPEPKCIVLLLAGLVCVMAFASYYTRNIC